MRWAVRCNSPTWLFEIPASLIAEHRAGHDGLNQRCTTIIGFLERGLHFLQQNQVGELQRSAERVAEQFAIQSSREFGAAMLGENFARRPVTCNER